MTGDAFVAWLASVTLTHPFTLDDARELFGMIRNAIDAQHIDVYTGTDDKVHVRVETERGVIERVIDVV